MEGQEIAKKEAGTSSAEAESLPEHLKVGGAEALYLIEEATYTMAPEHMKILLKRIPEDQLTPEKLILVLINLLALECGFQYRIYYPEELLVDGRELWGLYNFTRMKILAADVPIEWLLCSSGSFQEHHLYLFHCFEEFTLVTNTTADLLCVTLTSKHTAGSSVALSIPRYIPIIHRQNILRSFRNLPELSLRLKNKLFLPTRDMFMQMNHPCRPYPSLMHIPEVVKRKILKLLSKKSQDILREIRK